MSEESYKQLQSFEANGGEYEIKPVLQYGMATIPRVGWFDVTLEYRGITVENARASTVDQAVFLAFDALHQTLPASVVKW